MNGWVGPTLIMVSTCGSRDRGRQVEIKEETPVDAKTPDEAVGLSGVRIVPVAVVRVAAGEDSFSGGT